MSLNEDCALFGRLGSDDKSQATGKKKIDDAKEPEAKAGQAGLRPYIGGELG